MTLVQTGATVLVLVEYLKGMKIIVKVPSV